MVPERSTAGAFKEAHPVDSMVVEAEPGAEADGSQDDKKDGFPDVPLPGLMEQQKVNGNKGILIFGVPL